ncbi:MAG: Na/Pi symporter [Planctomycetota bacterium]|jgi:sodium-dependent phosphate cotransporter
MSALDGDTPGLGAAPADSGRASRLRTWQAGILAIIVLYMFVASVNMMGGGLKSIAEDDAGEKFLDGLFAKVDNPVTGLVIGLLVTSLVQSSSFTTAMTVGFVAAGNISLTMAIPIIMGANIGTSVTNILVSLAHVRRRLEFRRSFGAAVVHDFFNVLSVLLFLPMEYAFGVISRPTKWISGLLEGTSYFSPDAAQKMGLLKTAFKAMGEGYKWLLKHVGGLESKTVIGAAMAITALVLLFLALWMLVKLLRRLMQDRLSGVFDRTLFRNPATAFTVGIVMTAAVQSSSVTTSLVVPLVGAGLLGLQQVYPYTLGANIGTTVTAVLAALGTGSAAAMACAFGHLCFNLYGTAVFWPLQFVPISLAKGFAGLASRRRYVAIAFVLGFFFVLPGSIILIMSLVSKH